MSDHVFSSYARRFLKKIFGASSSILASNLFYTACQWAMISALMRLGGLSEVGIFSFALAITAPVFIFFQLGLRQDLAADASRKAIIQEYLIARVLATIAALTFTFFVTIAFAENYVSAVLAVGASKAIETFCELGYGLYQRERHFLNLAISRSTRGGAGLVSFTAVYATSDSLIWAIIAMSTAWAIVALFFEGRALWKEFRNTTISAGSNRFKNAARLALSTAPLGAAAALIAVKSNIPRYFLEAATDIDLLGAYSALNYFVFAFGLAIGSVGQVYLPSMSIALTNKNPTQFQNLLFRLTGLSIAIGITSIVVVAIVGPKILQLVFGSSMSGYGDLFIAIMVAGAFGFLSSSFNYALEAFKAYRDRFYSSLASTIVVLVLSALLVPSHGAYGAAAAAGGSAAIQGLLSWLAVRRHSADIIKL